MAHGHTNTSGPGTAASLVELTPFFKAFCSTTRARIIDLLLDGERCVCEITPAIDASQPLVSHHLAVLRDAGFVLQREEGSRTYYSIDWDAFDTRLDAFRALCERGRSVGRVASEACWGATSDSPRPALASALPSHAGYDSKNDTYTQGEANVDYTDIFVTGTVENVQNAVAQVFQANDFAVQWVDGLSGRATRGSKGANLAVGAFSQYYEMGFRIVVAEDQSIAVRLIRSTSGWAGGAIGAHKVKKRYKAVVQMVCDYFSAQGIYKGRNPA